MYIWLGAWAPPAKGAPPRADRRFTYFPFFFMTLEPRVE